MQCMYNLRVPQGAPVRPSVTDLRIYGFTPLPPPPVATTRDAHRRIKTLPEGQPGSLCESLGHDCLTPFPRRGSPHADGPDVGTVRGLCRLLARSPGSDRWLPGLV